MEIPDTVKVGDTLAYVTNHGSSCRKVTVSRLTPLLVECTELRRHDTTPIQFMRKSGVEKGYGSVRFPSAHLSVWGDHHDALLEKTRQRSARDILRALDCSAVPLATLRAAIALLREGGAK